MPPSSTISSKGQITLPLEIRHRLGVKEGVEFVVDEGRTIIRPAQAPENPFEKYIGALPAFDNQQQINKWVASMRDDETT